MIGVTWLEVWVAGSAQSRRKVVRSCGSGVGVLGA